MGVEPIKPGSFGPGLAKERGDQPLRDAGIVCGSDHSGLGRTENR